jgi:hypothetical protein
MLWNVAPSYGTLFPGPTSSPKTQVHLSQSPASTATLVLRSNLRCYELKKNEYQLTCSECEETASDTDSLSTSTKTYYKFRSPQKLLRQKQSFIVDSKHQHAHTECHVAAPSGDIRKALNGPILEAPRPPWQIASKDVSSLQKRLKFKSRERIQQALGTNSSPSNKISLLTGAGRTVIAGTPYAPKLKSVDEDWEDEIWYDEHGHPWTEVANFHTKRLKREQELKDHEDLF